MSDASGQAKTVCEQTNLAQYQYIQPHGLLIVTNQNLQISYCANNAEQFVGDQASNLLKQNLSHVLSSNDVKHIQTAINQNHYFMPFYLTDAQLWCYYHEIKQQIVLEFESQSKANQLHQQSYGDEILLKLGKRLDKQNSIQAAVAETVRFIYDTFDYQRIMAYQFYDDFSGRVIAETKTNQAESFLGLCFPSTDIPPAVRQYFRVNPIRYIPDIYADNVAILNAEHQNLKNLDIRYAMLRQVVPVHIEYLANMRVHSSLTIALFAEDDLWGLITCQHAKPKSTTVAERQFLSLMCNMLTKTITFHRYRQRTQKLREDGQLLMSFDNQLAVSSHLFQALDGINDHLMKIFQAQGISIIINGEISSWGLTPGKKQVGKLIQWLLNNNYSMPYMCHQIDSDMANYCDLKGKIAGMLVLDISNEQKNYLLLFRQELIKEIEWAGNPYQMVQQKKSDYSPRGSFERWHEMIKGQSQTWTQHQLYLAKFLRQHILGALLQENLKQQAILDHLTQAFNRRYLETALYNEIERASRESKQLTLLLMDIDHFKTINDNYGHLTGDWILRDIAQYINELKRPYDQLFRYGGEEFLLIIYHISKSEALQRAEQFRLAIQQMVFEYEGNTLTDITISMGVAIYPQHSQNQTDLIKTVDEQLYAAKEQGRNRVNIAS